jgi:hypothetical protein
MRHPLLPVLAGLVVLLAGGLLHGYWTLRWFASPALAAAAARLNHVPGNVAGWEASPLRIPEEQLVQAGAVAWKLQSYSSPESDVPISTLLLVGRSGAMTIHEPQHCYPGAGFEMKGVAGSEARKVRVTVKSYQGEPLGEFWTAHFERQTPTGPATLRIYWAWNAGGKWRAPDNPRWELASEPSLFKLYVIRDVTYRALKQEQEPIYRFLQELLPRLTPALSPAFNP